MKSKELNCIIAKIESIMNDIDSYELELPDFVAAMFPPNYWFSDKEDNEELLYFLKDSLKSMSEEHLYPLTEIIEKLSRYIHVLQFIIRRNNWDSIKLEANLNGFSLDYIEIDGEKYEAPINNPYAELIKSEYLDKINEIEYKLPSGQSPIKANEKYKKLAHVHRTLVEVFACRPMSKACDYLEIPQSSYTSWIAGKDKFGNKNKDKFRNWFENTPSEIIDELTPKLRKHLETRNYKSVW